MTATGHSQARSEPLLTICGSDCLHIRSHLKGNPVDAPQCLTLPRALVPPRGEKKLSTLRCKGPVPPSNAKLSPGTALQARSSTRCATAALSARYCPDSAPLTRLSQSPASEVLHATKDYVLESSSRHENGHLSTSKDQE